MVSSWKSNEARKRTSVIASAFAVIVIATAAAEVGPPFPQPYVVDPDRTGAVEAVWSREEGLPDATEGQRYAMSLRIDAPIPGLEAGVRLLGVDGRESLGSELGFDFRNDTGCGEWPQIQVVRSLAVEQDLRRLLDPLDLPRLSDLLALGRPLDLPAIEVTDVYRCGEGSTFPAPDNPASWTRVRFNVQPVPAGFSIRDVRIVWKGNPSRVLIDNLRIFEVVIGWPGLSIYIADRDNNRVVEIDNLTDSGWYARWATHGSPGSGTNQFNLPYDVYVDAQGRIYVADTSNHRIVRMDDISGAGWVTFGTIGLGVGQFVYPTGVFVDNSDRIYIADFSNNRLARIDNMAGAAWTTLGGSYSPDDVVVDNSNRIYVTDPFNYRVVRVDDMAGAGLVSLGPCIAGLCLSGRQFPRGVAVDAFGVIYFNDEQTLYRANDMSGSGFTNYRALGASLFFYVAKDDLGRIYLTNASGSSYGLIRMRDMAGTGRIDFGTGGTGVGQFKNPMGIYVLGREPAPCPCR